MVVSKLVALCAKELNASLDEISTISELTKDSYDIIIVDESVLSRSLNQSIEQILSRKKVVLYNLSNREIEYYDLKLKKPFLPHDLTILLRQNIEQTQKSESQQMQVNTPSNCNETVNQILSLEPQKIKEILAGAKVTITIDFPKEGKV
jgi:hypothetical protein